ncbi:4'-phosphopantetheinyl transferase family protein [Plantactinospora sp. GCM10030261]|uniref:4'-phosphopantetheinyl transferase family protein n=1 Tax=Plantactinospora sp. GCM10030261 TaxID=3273420 RepID=UPI0036069DBF
MSDGPPPWLAGHPGLSVPPDGVVHLWPIGLDQPGPVVAALYPVLDRAERHRAADHGPVPARRFVVARGAVRVLLGRYLGRPPAALRWRTGRWGKPALVDPEAPRFNLTHTAGVALLAVSRTRAVGVDLDRRRAGLPAAALAGRYFPAGERGLVRSGGPDAFLRLWVRKEAWVKAAGDRMTRGLVLPVAGPGPVLAVRDPAGRIPGDWTLRDLPAPPGYAACVALAGSRPFDPLWPAGEELSASARQFCGSAFLRRC